MPFIASVRGSYGPQGRFGRKINKAVGGDITFAGGYTIHAFTTVGSNTFTVNTATSVEYLIIGGGGG
jgi:hypothetical protein